MRRNWTTVSYLGLTIIFVTGLAPARSEQAKQITCTGKVVDAQGKPVTNAQVTLYRLTVSLEQISYEIKLAKEVTTKEDGTFAIKNEVGSDELSAQAFILARKEGLALGWVNWRLLENLDTEIKLGQAKILAGRWLMKTKNLLPMLK